MFDVASRSDSFAPLQRAAGELHVVFKRRGAQTVLDDLRQVGCLKARFPRVGPEEWTSAVMLNISGGVAGGDRLDAAFELREGARATVTAQAAERFYRALPGSDAALVRNRLHVAAGAYLEWLPQETLLFDRCALDRRLDVDLADDAWFLGVESLVFGRAAMGERVEHAWLRDSIRVRRGGHWLLHDAVRLDGAVDAALQRAPIAGGARAVATLVHVAPDAEAAVDRVRVALADTTGEAGVSAWNGMLVARILIADAAALRRAVMTTLTVLRAPRALPRVWLC
ncbi:MAG TPA: urease accessory protein UreD [Acetobacteraceae bacterium]|nr:urease accessory protein UreD [Acetobacteraceae bacterium]